MGGQGRLTFWVLGPVTARLDDAQLDVGGSRQRRLLALLLLRPGAIARTDWLIDELWAGEPPEGADVTIRTYVSRLRATLRHAGVISAAAGGYAMAVERDSVDAQRFEQLVRAADSLIERGQRRAARQRLQDALELWRGSPFGELGEDGSLRVEAERLGELCLHAVEERIEIDISLGRSAQLIDEIESLCHVHPHRERLWRLLMLALYHCGRQADALAAYQRARKTLVDELGIEPSAELRELEIAVLRQEVAKPRAVRRHDALPVPVTSFVGRAREIDDLVALLGTARIVTLTGVGGVGKTRLALEVGRRAPVDDGAVFVDLSAVTDRGGVAREVGRAVNSPQQGTPQTLEAMSRHLTGAALLIILDNCEQVLDAVAEVVRALLDATTDVRFLATSRAPLGLAGEVDVPVTPLLLPVDGASADEIRNSDAVRLLTERVRAARQLALDDEAVLADALRICRDLDGLPLAIELAAARAKALSLNDIASRLDDRFRFLISWRRVASGRHQTLKSAIDWSYDLLGAREQLFFDHLSVFAGGFTLPAAVAVLSLDAVLSHDAEVGDDAEDAVLDGIARLVDASLVVADTASARTRYRMLETVRQYAAARLVERGADVDARDRHQRFFAALAERAEPQLTGPDQAEWFARLDAEHANLLAALDHAALRDSSDNRALIEFTVRLTRFWYVRGYLSEARRRLERAVASADDVEASVRRRSLTATASVALLQGDYAAATRFAEASLEAARETAEDRLVANGLSNLGAIVLAAGDTTRAQTLLTDAVDLARRSGDSRILALALNNLADHALTVGEYGRAEPLFVESLDLLQERGDTANVARSLFNLGAVALRLGRFDDAAERLSKSLSASRTTGDREDMSWSLLGVAGLAAARGDGERAAVLLGSATELLNAMGAAFKPFERQLHDQTADETERLIGQQAIRDAMSNGRRLDEAKAVELALSITGGANDS